MYETELIYIYKTIFLYFTTFWELIYMFYV